MSDDEQTDWDALWAQQARISALASALELIATPTRPDGTDNLCRAACRRVAQHALDAYHVAQSALR